MREIEIAVDGDRVVERVHEGPVVAQEPEQAAAEALVVVDEVELVAAVAELLVDAAAEGVRLGEPGARHDAELLDVLEGAELVRPRDAERVLALVEVEAVDLLQHHRVVGDGPGLAREHRHAVAELGQLACQVAAVDALAATVRIAAVDEERDPQRARRG